MSIPPGFALDGPTLFTLKHSRRIVAIPGSGLGSAAESML